MANRKSNSRSNRFRKNRNRRGKNNNLPKILMMGSALCAIIIFGGATLTHQMGLEKIDDNYCYDRTTQHQTAILIDNSVGHDVSSDQLRDYNTAFQNAWNIAPPNSEFLIFTTASDVGGSIANPIERICKPAQTPFEAETLGTPKQTPPIMKRQYEEAYSAYQNVIESVVTDVTDSSKRARNSPLLEQVQAVSRYAWFNKPSRSFYFITDGTQNSDIARFCAVAGDMPSFSKLETLAKYDFVKPDSFTGVNVEIVLIESATLPQFGLEHCTNDEMRRWWPDYFKGNGANDVRLTRLLFGSNR